jgi:hypothetical protein
MSKKRKPKKRLPRALRRPPTDDESMDIAAKIYSFAELAADGDAEKAVKAIQKWVGLGPTARLRGHYMAAISPVLIMGLMRKHFPVDMEPDDLWVMERLDGADTDVHTVALCQVIVRHLNDDHVTATDLLQAHIDTHGDEGLFWFGVEAIKTLAGVIRSVHEQEDAEPV